MLQKCTRVHGHEYVVRTVETSQDSTRVQYTHDISLDRESAEYGTTVVSSTLVSTVFSSLAAIYVQIVN